jgi:hypothetical protein
MSKMITLVTRNYTSWSIGTMDQGVGTIMHLAMNAQKAIFKLVLHWASSMEKGKELKKRVKPLVRSVQKLRLPPLSTLPHVQE